MSGLLESLPAGGLGRLLQAMRTVETLLGAAPERRVPYILRPHQPGDLGWVVHRHGVLYAEEYGFDEQFEALVAEIAAQFMRGHDPTPGALLDRRARRCAGRLGAARRAVGRDREAAPASVEPEARGLGIGARLVEECSRFARRAGYRKITLWTNSVLQAARRIYEQAGYRLVDKKPHRSFGRDLIGETWELTL
jgi:GNAT superfamily N-acetyltransferase